MDPPAPADAAAAAPLGGGGSFAPSLSMPCPPLAPSPSVAPSCPTATSAPAADPKTPKSSASLARFHRRRDGRRRRSARLARLRFAREEREVRGFFLALRRRPRARRFEILGPEEPRPEFALRHLLRDVFEKRGAHRRPFAEDAVHLLVGEGGGDDVAAAVARAFHVRVEGVGETRALRGARLGDGVAEQVGSRAPKLLIRHRRGGGGVRGVRGVRGGGGGVGAAAHESAVERGELGVGLEEGGARGAFRRGGSGGGI